MNIEESEERVKKWCEFYRLREKTNIDFLFSIAEKDIPIESIETLLTAYEKEKEKNKELVDKIKAEIEELEKMNIHEFETMNVLEVLQSLLEKE